MKKALKHLITVLGGVSLASFAEENKKPFIQEHTEHRHKVDFVNATVFQQIKDYSSVYTTSHILLSLNFKGKDELFINASYTIGDGITKKTSREGFSITTTADDLESYLKNINDTGRKYILEAYYQKYLDGFVFVAGFIDSTSFIDANNFANDEHTQFLNSSLVNNPIAVLPSYNPGVFARYRINDKHSVSALFMDNSPDSDNVFIVEHSLIKEDLGLRTFFFQTTKTSQNGVGSSFDYSFSENSGVFLRAGYSNSDYRYFLSSGVVLTGLLTKDEYGFGVSFVDGKNGFKDIYNAEAFYEFFIGNHLTITVIDVQYIKEIKEYFVFGSRVYFSY